MPEDMSVERRKLLSRFGAELVLTPAIEGMSGAVYAAQELVEKHGYFMPQQFNNPSNPEVHRRTTALEIQSRLPNRWTATVPAGASSGDIEVRTARGNVRGPRFRVTAALAPPIVSSFAPANGSPGEEVLLSGENFSPRSSDNIVSLGGTPAVVRTANPTELRVLVPEGATNGPWRVSVTGAGEASSEASFVVGTGTSIASFEPTFGPPRTQVVIRGVGFHRSRARVGVFLGEARARVIRSSETELTVEVPRGLMPGLPRASGRWLVDVRGGGRGYSATEFDVRYAPVIGSIEPMFGAPGTRLTVTGEHFGTDVRAVTATLGPSELRVRDIAEDRLVLEIPPGAATGHLSLTVNQMGPTVGTHEIRVTPACVVSGFSPRNGGPGTEVTIHGRGFSATSAQNTVTLSGQPAEIISASESELTIRVPEARSGPIVVAVENAGQSRTDAPFIITAPPTIASFSPESGAQGTEVVIVGTHFGDRLGLIEVRLGGRRMPISRAGDTELRVVVPPGARSGPIEVSVRLQGSATHPTRFTVTGP
jgi:hypothetical protein